MNLTSALFDTRFQEQLKERLPPAPQELAMLVQERLEERLEALKEKGPCRLSCLELQAANNLPKKLAEVYDEMPSGALFLGVIAGGETLHELAISLMEAELDLTGSVSPRVAPMVELASLSRYLTAAGFRHTVADQERIVLHYYDMFELMYELRSGGWTNSMIERSRDFAPKNMFDRANEYYKKSFSAPSGKIEATVDLLFMHGWKE
jgi:hypothetical protein